MDNQEYSGFENNQDHYEVTEAQRFDIGLIFSDAFKVLRRGFLQFSAIFIFISIPLAVLSTIVLAQDPDQMANFNIQALSRQMFSMLFFVLLSLFPSILMIISAGDQIENNRKPFYDIFIRGLSRYPLIVISTIAILMAALVGFIMLVIPGIIIMTIFYFYIHAIALRKQGIFDSFIYSYELVKNNLWYCLLMGVIVIVATTIVVIPFLIITIIEPGNIAIQVIQSCFSAAIGIFVTILATVTFFNLESIYRFKHPGEMVPVKRRITNEVFSNTENEDD